MHRSLTIIAGLLLATAATAKTSDAIADKHRPATDTARDAARKPAELLDFARVGPGKKVVDFIPGHGYFTRLFAVATAPGGNVVAIQPVGYEKLDAEGAAALTAIGADPAYGNVTIVATMSDSKAAGADVVWTAQNYHDLHNLGSDAIVAGTNKAAFAALKPGGYYVVVDHAAVAGSGVAATNTLHRIDPAVVKAEVVAAGFVFDGESKVLANTADPHTAIVFDPAMRGKTDQFAYRFKKP